MAVPATRPAEAATRAVDLTSWCLTAVVGTVTLTQTFGWTGTRLVAVAQSLTPHLGIALVPVVLVALWRRRLMLVTVASAVGFGIAVLAAPLAFPDPQPVVAANSTGLRVASINLWYENTRIGEVDDALGGIDADVIIFSEFTPAHRAVLENTTLAEDYPYRSGRTGFAATGIVVWSRWPTRVGPSLDTFNSSLDLDVDGPDGTVRLVAVHMPTPVYNFAAWRDDLAIAADIGRGTDAPTLLIGDLNATYWHPDFRRILDAGFVDAHTALGNGFSMSWPVGRRVPPFVRIDHALTTGGLVSMEVSDIDIPGSDHRGLIVTVAPARPAAP